MEFIASASNRPLCSLRGQGFGNGNKACPSPVGNNPPDSANTIVFRSYRRVRSRWAI